MPCENCDSLYHDILDCHRNQRDEYQPKNVKCGCSNLHYHSQKCKNQKCYICFQRYNHFADCCPYQSLIYQKYFMPKIDIDLIGRFTEHWNHFERYFMALNSYPEVIKYIKLEPLKIAAFKKGIDRNNIVSTLYHPPRHFPYLPFNIKVRNFHIEFNIIDLKNKNLRFHPYFDPLFFTTKTVRLSNVTFEPKILLSQIISKFPVLEKLEIGNSNVDIPISWPKDILECIHGKTLKVLKLVLNSWNFNTEDLSKVMREKSTPEVRIKLGISDRNGDEENVFEEAKSRMVKQHFAEVEVGRKSRSIPIVSLFVEKKPCLLLAHFTLKEHENSAASLEDSGIPKKRKRL